MLPLYHNIKSAIREVCDLKIGCLYIELKLDENNIDAVSFKNLIDCLFINKSGWPQRPIV